MIRINLLPSRDAPRKQAALVQIVVFAILLFMAIAVLVVVDSYQRKEISAQRHANAQIQERIKRIQHQIRDHDQIREQIEEFDSKQGVINELQAGRTGPVSVMVELAKIMSLNGSPTIDHDRYMELQRRSSNQRFDPNWDGRRIWLESFNEESREVELAGLAMSHEDVAEFLRRLSLSDYFHNVVLVETRTVEAESNAQWASSLVRFQIRCRLRYGGRPGRNQEAGASAG